jgi:hypothetical protein
MNKNTLFTFSVGTAVISLLITGTRQILDIKEKRRRGKGRRSVIGREEDG